MTTSTYADIQNNLQPDFANFGPISLVILQATSFCNLNCDYCYLPDRQSKKVFNLDLIEPIFKNIFSSPLLKDNFAVCWHAGEPLAVPISFYEQAIAKINQVAEQYNHQNIHFDQDLQTNATLINQAWCDLFIKHDFQLSVSLDGPDFIHDAHRKTRKGLGTHAGTMRGIKQLQKNNLDFFTIAVLTKESLDHPEEMFNFFWDNGITEVGFNVEEVIGINRSSSLKGSEMEARFRNFMSEFWDLVVQKNGEFKLREFEEVCGVIYSGGRFDQNELNTPFSVINIDTQGNFCTFDPELLGAKAQKYGDFILGNILHDTFESVCYTEKFQHLYGDVNAGVDMCRSTCEYFGLCAGGSVSNKCWENGTARSSETMACKYYPRIVTDMILDKLESKLLVGQ